MQLLFAFDDRPEMLARIHQKLQGRFGPQGPFVQLDPVSQLVIGLVGVRTRGEVSSVAYQRLLTSFRNWDAVRNASVTEIHGVIRDVTFAEIKAPRLKAALDIITNANGHLTLENLNDLRVDDALLWLERLPGVGRKVAAATLNFSTLRKASLVIDTHHLRVLQRLTVVGKRADYKQAYNQMMPILPSNWSADDFDEHHQLMKILGQTNCRHAATNCDCCPLEDLCPTAT